MDNRAVYRATPRAGRRNGVFVSAVNRRDMRSITQIHERRDDFERGTRWAGIALVLMFAFLSFGAVVWGW